MNNRQPWQLKRLKSWGQFWSYQLNSTANSAHLAHFGGKQAELAVLFSWQLVTAPKILIFSIAMGADYSIELISIETYAPQLIEYNKICLGSVILVKYTKVGESLKKKECAYIMPVSLKTKSPLSCGATTVAL